VKAGREAEAQAEKLKHLIELKMKDYEAGWERLASALSNLSPLNILKKGYTICWKAGGLLPVVKATEVEPGDDLIVSFYRGEINCQVKGRDPRIKIESRFIKESK
jgi:exodeoxyribonuclease VII large subunit